jgi:asparagine synthase (glutamine-hydrolysing)
MSGIVGIFHRDGAAIDRELIQALTRLLVFRGPDSCDVWCDGPVGLGHTLLQTTRECPQERQPAGLDERSWITADARLDSRRDLIEELARAGRHVPDPVSDAEMILHAYAVWEEECVGHLRGDFSFAIWDRTHNKLFCARDHFGIRPFYYAEIGPHFLFSNTLNCLRAHPEVSEELNEAAVADFLLFGLNCDNRTTTFRDIRRLPPGHTLMATACETRMKRYWSPPVDGWIRYRCEDDYIEQFQLLLQAAVEDRLRTDCVGILLSGGLDSSSVAAMARDLSIRPCGATDLRAFTTIYESLESDSDRVHAGETAEFLKIPIRFQPLDSVQPFDPQHEANLNCPEPVDDPFYSSLADGSRLIAAECRVALSGEGNDNLMSPEIGPYWKNLVHRGDWGIASSIAFQYVRLKSRSGLAIRRRIRRFLGKDSNIRPLPKWIAADFARRVDLTARWKEGNQAPTADGGPHPIRPEGHASLSSSNWTRMFELENAGVTLQPVEILYPFLDLRVVNFLLSIPSFPWFFEKFLLREAMIGRLPEGVRNRPKTPVAEDPLVLRLPAIERLQNDSNLWTKEVDQFVDRLSLPFAGGQQSSVVLQSLLRPLCLNFWLQTGWRVRYNFCAEAWHG